jgi:hypothetical protein
MRKILVTISDTHAGMKLALMNPATLLFDENQDGDIVPHSPPMTATQEYLWDVYMGNILKTIDIAGNDEIVIVHLGDECNGKKYPSQLVTTRESDQIIIADYNMRPWFELPNVTAFRQVVGTEAHNFGEGSSALLLCQILQGRYLDVDIKPFYHALIEINGITIDCAHHGPGPGSRNWLSGNVARFYLRDLMQWEIMSGNKPPDMVLRGHYHTPVHELLETKGRTSELFVLPSFSMMGDHAIQVTQSKYEITHGFLVTEIVDGVIIKHHRLYETRDTRTREVL